MHVLVLPKWYPGLPDPQLGDFIRKQMLAVGGLHKLSVLHACAVPSGPDTYSEELVTQDGIWELHSYYRSNRALPGLARKPVNFRLYHRAVEAGVERLLKERGVPDLIHAHILTRPAYMAWLLARRWDIPFVISEQSSVHLNGAWRKKNPAAKYFDRFLTQKATRLSAVSAHLAAALEAEDLGSEYAIVPNVVPHLDKALPPAGDPHRFLVVADLVDATKNISGVLKALATARGQDPAIRLDVIGGGPDEGTLKELATQLGLEGRVHWHGRMPQAEVFPIMARTGTVIVNSNYETFSVVTGEALASGKPVIATRCGGPEGFMTAGNGLLIPVGNEAALADALLLMTREHDRFAPERIRASVSERFSPQAVAADFDKVYREALHAHG